MSVAGEGNRVRQWARLGETKTEDEREKENTRENTTSDYTGFLP